MNSAMRRFQLIFLQAVAIAVLPALVANAQQRPSGSPAAKPPSANKPADKPAEPADPYVVPEGSPKELVAYIKRIAPLPVRDLATLERKRQAILKAAEKILAGKPNDTELVIGVQAKMTTLENAKQLAVFADELKKAGRAQLARMVRRFTAARELGLAARQFDMEARVGPPSPRSQENIKSAVRSVIKYLQEATPEVDDVGLADLAGQATEMIGDDKLAATTYAEIGKAFAASKDPQLAEFTQHMQGVARRLTLVGNPVKIEGKLLNGQPFDWSKYRDKVVLIDFWATWCAPCVAEMPRLRKLYDFYHDKGFEIIGISDDRRLSDLETFVKEKKLPWPIVFNGQHPSPTIRYYGVQIYPTMILVGKDGKVLTIDARGPELKEWLAKLLGPMPSPKKGKNEESGKSTGGVR